MMPKLPSQHTAGGAGPRPAQTGPSRHGHLAPWLEEAAQAVLPKAPRSPGQNGLSGSSASSSGVWFLFPKSRKSLRYTGTQGLLNPSPFFPPPSLISGITQILFLPGPDSPHPRRGQAPLGLWKLPAKASWAHCPTATLGALASEPPHS